MCIALLAIGIASCQKKTVEPCVNPLETFQNEFKGNYKQVGFKNAVFSSWSYSSQGPTLQIQQDSIAGTYNTKYQVMDQHSIYLFEQNQLVRVSFGDTVVFAFQNGDSTKLIKY